MSTDTLERTDSSTDTLPDFDVVCCVKTALVLIRGHKIIKECENPARWAANYPCCGEVMLVCDPHRTNRNPWFCVRCELSHDTLLEWRPL